MSFPGFSQEIVGLLKQLKANNDKAWFDANRSRFDELVIAPSLQLVASLSGPLSQMRPALKAVPKVNGSIRRIHRDTRFSKDKTPYHTHLHLVFWAGEHPSRSPGVHVILAEDHFGFGAGHWAFDGAALQRYRVQVTGDGGKAVAAAIEAVRPLGVVLDEPELARVPTGFDAQAPGADWLRHKGLVVQAGKRRYPSVLFGPSAVDHIAGLCAGLAPLNRYLAESVYS
jgi:uncharacterized protein (TIGR02453 family)